MRNRRPLVLTWILIAFVVAACGPSARQKALRTSLTAVTAAAEGFGEFDIRYQQAIVDQARADGLSREALQAKIADYREHQTKIVDGFRVACQAIAVAALTKDTPLTSVVATVEAAIAAAAKLRADLDPPGGGTP